MFSELKEAGWVLWCLAWWFGIIAYDNDNHLHNSAVPYLATLLFAGACYHMGRWLWFRNST